jgi:hypothetical protein
VKEEREGKYCMSLVLGTIERNKSGKGADKCQKRSCEEEKENQKLVWHQKDRGRVKNVDDDTKRYN